MPPGNGRGGMAGADAAEPPAGGRRQTKPAGGAGAQRAGAKPAFTDDEADALAYDDPLYATDSFRLNCFK